MSKCTRHLATESCPYCEIAALRMHAERLAIRVADAEDARETLRTRVAALENAIDAHRTMTLKHEDGPGAWDRSLWRLLEEVEP